MKLNEIIITSALRTAVGSLGKSLKDISNNWQVDRTFHPKMKSSNRKNLINGWDKAIRKTLS